MTLPRTLRSLRAAARLDRADVLTALFFGLAAAICRAVLTRTETRAQLLVMFAMLAAAAIGPAGQRAGFKGFALNCAAVVFAVLAVKFTIEGRPHLHATIDHVLRLLR